VGPADLAVCYGTTDQSSAPVREAMQITGRSARSNGKSYMTFAGSAVASQSLHELGVNMFSVASEHAFMLQAARSTVTDIKTFEA